VSDAPLSPSLFLKPVQFVAGVQTLDQLPDLRLPEVAFIGRSNVGKSSLLNALTNNGKLARTSQTPGATKQLNFFNVVDVMHLVDVPGYGYAKAAKKDVKMWQGTLFSYLRGRAQLARAFMLVDARHGIKDADKEMFKLLNDSAVSFQIVLTKIDKITAEELERVREQTLAIAAKQPAAHPGIISTSADKKLGIDALREAVIEALEGKR
jgi:GTP-binding protein